MADAVKDLRALPLQELIGAPLVALVQAQALASRATVDFVEQVGFISGATESAPAQLRMAEFRYEKNDSSGTPAAFAARVPVLSLVPIPGIQVKDARIAFTAKITDAFSEPANGGVPGKKDGSATPAFLRPVLTHFRGSLAPERKPGTHESRGSCELNIEVTLEKMPIAPGLEKVLQMMEQAIQDAPATPVSSPPAALQARSTEPATRPSTSARGRSGKKKR